MINESSIRKFLSHFIISFMLNTIISKPVTIKFWHTIIISKMQFNTPILALMYSNSL
jgi:hypothetical protein